MRIKTRSFWAPELESASTSKCMTPTLGTRPVSSVGLATNWRLSTVGNQTHPDSSFVRQKFLYEWLSICFSSCIFHSCIFHSRIFSAPYVFAATSYNALYWCIRHNLTVNYIFDRHVYLSGAIWYYYLFTDLSDVEVNAGIWKDMLMFRQDTQEDTIYWPRIIDRDCHSVCSI